MKREAAGMLSRLSPISMRVVFNQDGLVNVDVPPEVSAALAMTKEQP
jgi:hypothetical protein